MGYPRSIALEDTIPNHTTPWHPLVRFAMFHALPVLLVIGLSIGAFVAGVDTSERPGMPQAAWHVQLYYTLGLFALGGMDLGMPTGGPSGWRVVLWLMYFTAPALAAIAVVEGLWHTFQPWLRVRWPWRNHVIVVGAGRVGWACIQAVRERWPRATLLVVERHRHGANWSKLETLPRLQLVHGEIQDTGLLHRLRVHRARAMLLLTCDEVVNMEVAAQVSSGALGPTAQDLPILARVSSLDLLQMGGDLFPPSVQLVNLHEGAASHVFERVRTHIGNTKKKDVLVLAGFGRFGRTFLRCLLREGLAPELHALHLIDPDIERCWAQATHDLKTDELTNLEGIVHLHEGGLRDPRVWQPVLSSYKMTKDTQDDDTHVVALLTTNDYTANLRAAITLRAQLPHAFLAARTFERTAFSEQMENSHRIHGIYIASDLHARVRSHWLPRLER